MELFVSRQNVQIAPVLDTCGWRCSVTPASFFLLYSKISLAIPTLQREDYKTGSSILLYIPKKLYKSNYQRFHGAITQINDISKEYKCG